MFITIVYEQLGKHGDEYVFFSEHTPVEQLWKHDMDYKDTLWDHASIEQWLRCGSPVD